MAATYAIQSMFLYRWDSDSQQLEELLAIMQSHVNDLRKFQGNVQDLMDLLHALALINSLPESWSQTVNVLMSKDKTELENVITTLKRTAHHLQIGIAAEAANSVQHKAKGKGKAAKANSKLKCSNCAKSGHTKD